MSEYVPEPWVFALLALAAFRIWKLVADDRILDRPRDWLLGKMTTPHRQDYWGDFLVCPWCAGFWISGITLAVYLEVFASWPDETEEIVAAVVVWFAISAIVGSLGTLYEALTDD